jgi:fumarylpyruvate hydrolase
LNYVFAAHPQPVVPVAGSDAVFPVHRIYCIGQNYADHAREMGSDPERETPFFFMKPADAVVENGASIPYPPATRDFHHEIELVVAIGKICTNIAVESALDGIFGYAVGIDLTRRDLQTEARKVGRPWDASKGFDRSAPCTAIHRVDEIGHPQRGEIWLDLNGERKQHADISQLIWSVPEQIAILSSMYTLLPGDLIFSGTPAGIGPMQRGDTAHGGVQGVDEITVHIA